MSKSKKTKEESKPDLSKNYLTKDEFIEWKATIYEMMISKNKLEQCNLEYKNLQKDAELADLKAKLYSLNMLPLVKKNVEEKNKAYDLVKKKIEDRIGYSLNSKTINELTFEILNI